MIFWKKQTGPLETSDHTEYRVLKTLRFHIKYCPVDNPEETHIIKKQEFNKSFKQTTKKDESNI